MGVLAWLAVTIHAFIWYIKWIIEGNFWNNLVALRYLMVAPDNVCIFAFVYIDLIDS